MRVKIDKVRIGGSKVKSGCRTCKKRRVKCDEAKPGCKRCERAGRTCEGYSSFLLATRAAVGGRFIHYVDPAALGPKPSPNTFSDLDTHALRSLEFFHHSTARQLERPFGPDIWSHGLSCLMHSEPAVKHGLVALAALHENYQHASKSVSAEQRRILALEHYGRSIQRIVQSNINNAQDALGPTVVTSLLYCAIESLQGHFYSAIKHITAGVRLLSEYENNKQGSDRISSGLLATLRCVFVSLRTQAVALGGIAFEGEESKFFRKPNHSHKCSFSTVGEALTEIACILNSVVKVLSWTEATCKLPDFPCFELQQARQALLQRYEYWTESYHELSNELYGSEAVDDQHRQSAFLVLRMNQAMARVVLAVVYAKDDSRFDHLTDDFEIMVSAAEDFMKIESEQTLARGGTPRPIFSLSLGIIPALFFACVRCRHRPIRHRALAVMKSSRRRESVWDMAIVASVAERVIAIEEAAGGQNSRPAGEVNQIQEICKSDIFLGRPETSPDCVRIRTMEVDFLESDYSARISLLNRIGFKEQSQVLVWDG